MTNAMNRYEEIREERMAMDERYAEETLAEEKPHESFLAKFTRALEEMFSCSNNSDPYTTAYLCRLR